MDGCVNGEVSEYMRRIKRKIVIGLVESQKVRKPRERAETGARWWAGTALLTGCQKEPEHPRSVS